jgi:hypothetical protein
MENKKWGKRFLQSAGDFPCMVNLGARKPFWELNRWGSDTLRFSPFCENKYAIQGNTRQLLYKGREESHRFTILNNSAFEYDLILKQEPETNKIYLLIEGWERFDFLKQPETFGPDSLRGSYAVYRKEQIIGSPQRPVGTGKLCHIHRPEIRDARGRKIWGTVHIEDGIMTIAIPEYWLGEAGYPVVIDPVIGTATVGAYATYPWLTKNFVDFFKERDGAAFNIENYLNQEPFAIYDGVGLNQFTLGQDLKGRYVAYFYAHGNYYDSKYDFRSWPVLFNNTAANEPSLVLSDNETEFNMRVSDINPEGWKTAALTIPNQINSGTTIWFGLMSRYARIRFDYGLPCIKYELEYCVDYQTVRYWDEDNEEWSEDEAEIDVPFHEWLRREENVPLDQKAYKNDSFIANSEGWNLAPGARIDFKLSMYLETVPTSHTRTLIQGATLTDARKLTGNYQRSTTQTTRGTAEAKRFEGFYRSAVEAVKNIMSLHSFPTLIRKVAEVVAALYATTAGAGFNRGLEDMAGAGSVLRGVFDFIRALFDHAGSGDGSGSFIGRMRVVQDTETVDDVAGYTADYLRGLFVEAGSIAETARRSEYLRKQQDTALSGAVSLRHLFVFIRLLTGAFIRDFIIGRFLKSNEELVLKSLVCREIVLDSKIH